MASYPFFSYPDQFPTTDAAEITALVGHLGSIAGFNDIYQLGQQGSSALGNTIKDEPPVFAAFWATLASKASALAAAGKPNDPDKPTAWEQKVLDGMLDAFYGHWPQTKRQALAWFVAAIGNLNKTDDPYAILNALGALPQVDAAALATDEFFEALAGYYLNVAQEYIRTQSVSRTFLGRVVDDTNRPKAGVRVACTENQANRGFGSTTTNREGYYRIAFRVLVDVTTPIISLKLTFTHRELNAPQTRTGSFDPAAPKNVSVEQLSFTPAPSVSKTVASTGTAIPVDVQTYLTAEGLSAARLEDIRDLGGFKNLPSKNINKTNPALLELDSLANLELLQPDVAKNRSLITNGYKSITDIALSARGAFIKKNGTLLSDLEAAKLHYGARAAHLFGLNSAIAKRTTIPAYGTKDPTVSCTCPDCSSAVSPMAYMADLASFAENNLQHGDDPDERIDLVYLKETFLQEYPTLTGCSRQNESVCQNRIATEVLRALHTVEPPQGSAITDLATAEKQYLTQCYELLLNKLGTSYTELRAMRGVTDEARRTKLTARLGIVSTDGTPVPTLDQLLIDLSDTANIIEGIPGNGSTAKGLEPLFGLRNTLRSPLLATPVSKVVLWKKAHLRRTWETEDGLKNAFVEPLPKDRPVIIDPDVVSIDDLRDPTNTTDLVVDRWNKRREWLDAEWAAMDGVSGMVTAVARDAFKDSKIIVAYDRVLQLVGLTTLTYQPQGVPPPDFITFGVEAAAIVDGNTYVKVDDPLAADMSGGSIWTNLQPNLVQNPNKRVRNCLKLLERVRAGQTTAHVGVLASGPVIMGWPELTAGDVIITLREAKEQALSADATGLATIEARGFTLASTSRFLELYEKNQIDPTNYETEGNLNADEWAEVKNILIAVMKQRLSNGPLGWRAEEANIMLGPHNFWPALQAPTEGISPYDISVAVLIDPSRISTKDLPDPTAQQRTVNEAYRASARFAERLEALKQERTLLVNNHMNSFQALLDRGFNFSSTQPGPVWNGTDPAENEYLNVLNALADPDQKAWAEFFITRRLLITEAELRTVISIGIKEEGAALSPGEKEVLYATLLRARKQLARYPQWQGIEGGTPHWQLRKTYLPKWRATAEQRSSWLQALAENSERPIIDGNLIGPGDMRRVDPDDHTNDLREARLAEVNTWIDQATTGAGVLNTPANFDAVVKQMLGHVEPDLNVLRLAAIGGVDIRPRLAQLDLTNGTFNQLLICRDLLAAASNSLTNEEKASVRRILAHVKKRRQALVHRLQEMFPAVGPRITLSQDFFRIPQQGIVSFPPVVDFELTPWLAEEYELIFWRKALTGRIELEKSVLDNWKERLFEVDDAMMVHLRDALVRASGDPDLDPVQNARALGDRLLIDLENNCCYKTNRLATAIETLQQLIWKTRTGDILANHPGLRYTGDDFDEAWTWMGSYANWRAAMFVFLYPENVLHPSFRRDQTPAFLDIVQTTRSNRRFGPDDTCKIGHTFNEYIDDLQTLEVACAQQARAWLSGPACGLSARLDKKLNFIFATAKNSGKTYFTTVDSNDTAAPVQNSFWQVITRVPIGATVRGCDLYRNAEEKLDHIYLFFTTAVKEDANKFYTVRYSLLTQSWEEEEPNEFSVEEGELHVHAYRQGPQLDKVNPKILALRVLKNTPAWMAPQIAISLREVPGGGQPERSWVFERELDPSAKKFRDAGDWDRWSTNTQNTEPTLNHGSLEGMLLDYWYHYPTSISSLEPDGNSWSDGNGITFFLVERAHQCFLVRKSRYLDLVDIGVPVHPGAPDNDFRGVDVGNLQSVDQLLLSKGDTDAFDALICIFKPNITPAAKLFWEFDNSNLWPRYASTDLFITFLRFPDYYAGSEPPTGWIQRSINPFFPPNATRFIPVNAEDSLRAGEQVNICQDDSGTIFFGSTWHELHVFDSDNNPISDDNTFFHWGPTLIDLSSTLPAQLWFGSAGNADTQLAAAVTAEVNWIEARETSPRALALVAEGEYFIPMQIALQLQTNGHYQAALDWFRSIYDYTLPLDQRKISYLLRQEEELTQTISRTSDWYSDPLNPHAIAGTRPHTYTRYTIRCIVSCLLDYADSEFTMDTSETVPRARELYQDALALLKLLEPDHDCPIDEWGDLSVSVPKNYQSALSALLATGDPLASTPGFAQLYTDVRAILVGNLPVAEKLAAAQTRIDTALAAYTPPNLTAILAAHREQVNATVSAAMDSAAANAAVQELVRESGLAFTQAMTTVTGLPTSDLETKDIPWLSDSRKGSPFPHGHEPAYFGQSKASVLQGLAKGNPAAALQLNSRFPNVWISGVDMAFCAVNNPIVSALILKAEVELFKIRNCMNIAGMVRELDPFSAPTDSSTGIQVIGAAGGSLSVPNAGNKLPSAYRYRTLMERARQLVSMAQQVEAAFLATLEKLDAERYGQLRADQDLETSKANIKLQDLKVNEANSGVRLAELQRERAQLQVSGLQTMVRDGLLLSEQILLRLFNEVAHLTSLMAWSDAIERTAQMGLGLAGAKDIKLYLAVASAAVGVAAAVQGAILQGDLARTNEQIQLQSLLASFERRKQEWEFQGTLAKQDIKLGDQQIKLANDRVRIVGQERAIAVIQNDHAKATLDFLKNKFTNAELYEWMSGVLEDAYAWFLQEATAVARLAETQLAFERQLELPPFIRSDYWVIDPNQLGSASLTGDGITDRRGLTGSTRLLKDLTELDQYGFSTNSPKLQLSKTLSLSEVAPEELMALRDRGIANFRTTHDQFDRDYPGHYLRLIKKVSVTVIALNPPTKGIRATLANGGPSRVITGGTIFQERTIKRYPEQIALSGGVSDQGVFQLQGEGEFLNPFEACGVDTAWEFRMEKAANPFNFDSIADVLLTIEYEALHSHTYRSTMVERLNADPPSTALVISMKNNLPDQWFDLHNPQPTIAGYQTSFRIDARDLVPNLAGSYAIERALVYVIMKDGSEFTYTVGMWAGSDASESAASVVDGIANLTTSVTPRSGPGPIGEWTIAFRPLSEGIPTDPFEADLVADILIIFTYNGLSAKYSI